MPGFTENVRPFISKLSEENNYLRYVYLPDMRNFSFEVLEDIAYVASSCINIFIHNYSRKIDPKSDKVSFHLPIDYKTGRVSICEYRNTPN